VNHDKLAPGLYVSRIDAAGNACVTTFDIRMKTPNRGDYLTTTAAHSIEHLGATFLRGDPDFGPRTVYFGPMGCRTGFYAVFFGELSVVDVSAKITEMFSWIASYDGEMPGGRPEECGNYRDLDIGSARAQAAEYLAVLGRLDASNTVYAV
jgi:S-ribosylhomocysteine lyase